MKTFFFALFVAFSLASSAQTYTVMTYNIRYKNPGDGEDKWSNRLHGLVKQVRKNNPDVIGFQEVLLKQMQDFNWFLHDYARVGVGRDNGKRKGEYSPIFYKKDKFTLVDKGWFWLSETPAKPSKGWDAACKRICTWAVLRDTVTKQEFAVFNTHLDHKGKEARRNGLALISDSIAAVCARHITHDSTGKLVFLPVITTGDFNFNPTDENYSRFAVLPGSIDLPEGRPRQDSYTLAAKPLGTLGTANAFRLDGEYTNRIDYIWVTDFRVDSYQVLNDKLPNGHWPSDHFPVLVKLTLVKP